MVFKIKHYNLNMARENCNFPKTKSSWKKSATLFNSEKEPENWQVDNHCNKQ